MTDENASPILRRSADDLGKRQGDLQQATEQLINTIRNRCDLLLKTLEQFAVGGEERKKLVEQRLLPEVQKLLEKANAIAQRNRSRPSVCVVGKRGSGKTTLLRSWLGPDSPTGGIEEIKYLPSGDSDTTACLVRLSLLDEVRDPHDADFLHVTLFDASGFPVEEPDKRPPAPGCGSPFRVSKRVSGSADVGNAYHVCRFPLEEDTGTSLRDDGGSFVLDKQGTISLAAVQWHARQVEIPLRAESVPGVSHAGTVLQVAAIVDAPGADSTATGEFQEWKLKKNAKVFETATRELDVLLLVSSCRTDAIQLGNQAQRDIWYPWTKRCKGQTRGRLLLAITRCNELFAEAESQLQTDPQANANDQLSFRRKLWKNLLEPLMVAEDAEPIVRRDDPTTWPPVFFFEKDVQSLSRFAEGVEKGSASRWAARLLDLLHHPDRDRSGLPIGPRCVLWMAEDWNNHRELPSERLRPFQSWLIESLCALLDPEDRGYRRLTEFVERYATTGPVAENHVQERKQDVRSLFEDYESLVRRLAEPGDVAAREQLVEVCQSLGALLQSKPGGPDLRLRDACRTRREQADRNSRPLLESPVPMEPRDIWLDVVRDSLHDLSNGKGADIEERRTHLERILVACLDADHACRALVERHALSFDKDPAKLETLQSVGMERLARVILYLGRAGRDEQRLVLEHCLKGSDEGADLAKLISENKLDKVADEDRPALEKVQKIAVELLQAIRAIGVESPYASK